jgi:hypothetical protein
LAPGTVAFHASSAHDTLVRSYRLDVFPAGGDPNGVPIASSDLGKPSPDAVGDIALDRAAFLASLKPGTYLATVTAVGVLSSQGEGRSTPVVFVR